MRYLIVDPAHAEDLGETSRTRKELTLLKGVREIRTALTSKQHHVITQMASHSPPRVAWNKRQPGHQLPETSGSSQRPSSEDRVLEIQIDSSGTEKKPKFKIFEWV
jgi:hypothetical protein